MLILLTILVTVQIATLLFFGRKLIVENAAAKEPEEGEEAEDDAMAEAPLVYATIDQMETLGAQLRAYIDQRIDSDTTSTEQFGELSEHVDSILDIVTSLATEDETTKQDILKLVDRVSRLAFNGATTKQLLDKTIDSIDWGDDDISDDTDVPVSTEEEIANLPPLRGSGMPYRPPLPTRTLIAPTEPLPEAPVRPLEPTAPPVAPPMPRPQAPVEDSEPVPLKEARADGDPMITDLRAEPFHDHPDATHDLHELPMSGSYEEMGAGGRHSRRSSRTRRL